MEIEVANESFSSLEAVPDCTKNPNHEGFDNFVDLNLNHLPVEVRNEDTLSYIKNLGDRVVRLEVKGKRDSIFGSGVVFKAGPTFVIMTNDHVVGSEEDVNNCVIDFFYNTEDRAGVQQSYGQSLLGCSDFQDRSLFLFSPVPQAISDMEMCDNSELIADVTCILNDSTRVDCFGSIIKTAEKWLVLSPRTNINTQNIVSCEVTFHDKTNLSPHSATFVGIHHVEDKMIHIEITDVPEFVQAASLTSWIAPWPMGNRQFTPFVIAHPHGGPKKITQGKSLAIESDGIVGKLYHTAKTCPGSSGGLVITVGGDASHYLGYAAEKCIHCLGENAEEFRGISIETGNLNIALFNNA